MALSNYLRFGGRDEEASPEEVTRTRIPLWNRTWDMNGTTYRWLPSDLATGNYANWNITNPALAEQLREAAIPVPGLAGKYMYPESLAPRGPNLIGWGAAGQWQDPDPWYQTPEGMAALFAGGVGGATALGLGAGAGELATLGAGGEVIGGSAPYVSSGTLSSLGETALPAAGIGGGATGAVAGLYGGPEFQGEVLPQSTGTGVTTDAFGNRIGGYFPAGSAGAAGAAAGGVAGSSALGRLLGLGQTGQDLLSVGGALAPAGLGYLGARQQADAYRDVANQYLGLGAPYRSTLAESYKPGFDLLSQPGYEGALNRIADISARRANVTYGNPYDAAAQGQVVSDVWNQGYLPALSNYRSQLGTFGGLGVGTAGAASMGGAGTAGGGLNAIGYGLNQLMRPPDPLEEALRRYSLTIGGVRV